MSLEQQVGQLMGHAEAQNKKLDRVVDGMEKIIPVLATHEEKHKDLDNLWIPQIKDTTAKFDRLDGAFKLACYIGSAVVAVAGILVVFIGH